MFLDSSTHSSIEALYFRFPVPKQIYSVDCRVLRHQQMVQQPQPQLQLQFQHHPVLLHLFYSSSLCISLPLSLPLS